ncbi:MAG: hypothetical protein ACRCU2_27765 [Planktothrix sp.]
MNPLPDAIASRDKVPILIRLIRQPNPPARRQTNRPIPRAATQSVRFHGTESAETLPNQEAQKLKEISRML